MPFGDYSSGLFHHRPLSHLSKGVALSHLSKCVDRDHCRGLEEVVLGMLEISIFFNCSVSVLHIMYFEIIFWKFRVLNMILVVLTSYSRSPSVDASNPGNNLYVTGLSTRVTSADVEKFFNKEGKV